jgi:ubiquinone biosynthesis UbiH/UbiF/VisC/COQ6 family hydroxylase
MRTPRDLLDVVVVGAGMVGAAAALACDRAGLRVALVDARADSAPTAGDPVDLRVVAIAPHAERLLEGLGVWRAIAAVRAAPYRRMHVEDALGGASLDFDAADYGWPRLGHIVENRLVAGALNAAIAREGRVCVEIPAAFARAEPVAHGMRVHLADGRRLDARLLVGADGAASPVRADAQIGVGGGEYGQSALVCHVEHDGKEGGTAWQRFLPSGPLAFLPLADGRSSIVWTLPTARAIELRDADPEVFEAQLARASDGRFGAVRLSSPRATHPLRRQIAQRFSAPGLVLVGDAAHVVHPLAGQGVNLGFEDVTALLALVDKARAGQRALFAATDLARWARERRSEATLAARAFDGLNRLYAIADGPLVPLRQFGLGLVDRIVPVKRKLAERAAGIRAG